MQRARTAILKTRREETNLSEPEAQLIITREGVIVDCQLYQDNPSDSALVKPAIERPIDQQQHPVAKVWGDRGLASKPNATLLENGGIGNGLCPRNVIEPAEKLNNEEGYREGLKRRAATEGRIGICKNVFRGRPLLAKGFEHRELAVGRAVITHNLCAVARLAEAETKRKEDQEQKTGTPREAAA
jgi:hypothetical protein